MPGKYSALYAKALSDPKYAEYKRRDLVAQVKESKQSVTQIKNVISTTKDLIKKNNKEITDLSKRLVTLDANNDNVVDNPANASEFTTKTALLKKAEIERKSLNTQLTTAEQSLTREQNQLSQQNLVLTKLDEITGVTSNTLIKNEGGSQSGQGDNKIDTGTSPDLTYIFNAPMVKAAYFTTNSITANSMKKGNSTQYPQAMSDALADSFRGDNGNRGAIQMDPDTAVHLKSQFKKFKGVKIDKKAYGFRFHYNPTSVAMTYGAMMDVAPEAMRDETKKFNAITPLNVGGIDFTLYLNRMEDLSYVQSNGTLLNKLGEPLSSEDLYGVTVPKKDLQQIWKKGTMYDLEYLFRAVHSGSNDYRSTLRGTTSDIGWLVGVAVELHLGDGLRYKVVIDGISINHAVFNERMVPMLSTVNVRTRRFYDVGGVATKRLATAGGGVGGRFGVVVE